MVAPVEVPVLRHSCWRPAAEARCEDTHRPGPPSLVTPSPEMALSVAPPGSPATPDVTQYMGCRAVTVPDCWTFCAKAGEVSRDNATRSFFIGNSL